MLLFYFKCIICKKSNFVKPTKITIFVYQNILTMSVADNIRNNIIDKLLTISNKEYLSALYQLVNSSAVDDDVVNLSEAQILMLNMSDEDIKNDRLGYYDQLD